MSAFAYENANKVWQRVNFATQGANAAVRRQLEALKMFLATQGKNPDLQFLTFTDAQLIASGGTVLGSGTPKVYAIYLKKGATATVSYFKLCDDATDDTTAAHQRIVLPMLGAAVEEVYVNPAPVALATGIVVNADTTVNGTTDSTAGDAGSGFVLVG